MAHIKTDLTRAEATPKEWLKVGSEIGYVANVWSNRNDLVAYVGAGAGGSAPACYSPALSEIEVNVEIAFGKGIKPEQVGNMSERKTQYEFPKATGAILHEAFHARFSGWSMPNAFAELKKDEYQALILLEESRIEYQGILTMPNSRTFLRSCAMEIVIGDTQENIKTETETKSLTDLVGLVHTRIDADVLEYSEVKSLVDMIESQLGLEVVSKLRDIASKFMKHDNHKDLTEVYPLAKEWARIVRETSKERGDEEKPKGSRSMPAKLIKDLLDAMESAIEDIQSKNFGELLNQEESEEWKEEVAKIAQEAKKELENEQVASEVFSKSSGAGQAKTNSTLVEVRTPSPSEYRASVMIGEALERAKYRERDETQLSSFVPPGRLRTRAIVQNTALRARGQMATAQPFRRTVRKHTDEPTLNVGVMVDISGSMGGAMNPMATTAWVMSEAVNRIQGNCAMVYFGNDVFATLKKGQRLDKVNVYSAKDGTEKFNKAFQALNGELNLTNGNGARLLVIVSDGEYVGEEIKKAKEIVAECESAGVAILWLPFDNGNSAIKLSNNYAEIVTDISTPEQSAEIIGRACEKVMTKVGQRIG